MKKSVKHHISTKLSEHKIPELQKPKEASFGHFASPVAFSLAKELKKSPNQIAAELAEILHDPEHFDSVEAISGFINFKLSSAFLDKFATQTLEKGFDFAKPKEIDKENILLEFVSANPTGPLHIGHARGAIYGDALLQIGRYLGHNITSEYYVNDAGRQVYLLGVSIYLRAKEDILKESVEYPEEFYRGEYIYELAEEAVKEFGREAFANEDIINTLSVWGKDKMMVEIRQNLDMVGIKFDNFVSEKEVFKEWDKAKAKLDEHSALYEKDGKIWLKTTEHKDEKDRVVVRENGEPTYLAGDITYHKDKFERGFDRYINIWGADHHGYISRVKSAIEFLGYDSSKLEVLLSQMVALLKDGEPYKMSKRAGNFILMKDVVDDIGSDALRFVFLSKKSDTHLEFDVSDLNKEDSTNPVFYINYAHARIYSLFEKRGVTFEYAKGIKLPHMTDDEKELLFTAMLLGDVLEDAFTTRDVQKITEYLKNLANKLHRFYTENRILGSEREDVYLKIFAVVALGLRVGLKLLGIEAKEKMQRGE
ncbi:MAG: arginine--tRNA ligase [Campylobacteraceae bacterium]|jgi:arginyl-tRNA synthetase|nr:arginine--tRNA ligase [Campylobacteraceae bacterium]